MPRTQAEIQKAYRERCKTKKYAAMQISKEQFNETFSEVLSEVFEFYGRPFYLEVLSNERDFVGCLRELHEDCSNMSEVMEFKDGRYAFQSPDVKTTYFAYDTIADARRHAAHLLNESLQRFSI